jgi:cytidylate kinase
MIKNAFPKIWLTASLEKRAKRISEREKIDFNESVKIVEQRQNAERIEWKKIYGVDYLRQENKADIIIDTSNLSPERVAEKIFSLPQLTLNNSS